MDFKGVNMQLNEKNIEELGTLVGFMQASGPAGYEFLKDMSSEDLPDVEYIPMTISDVFNFSYKGNKIGTLVVNDMMFGVVTVNGEWDNEVYDYQTFAQNLETVFTELEKTLNELETQEDLEK